MNRWLTLSIALVIVAAGASGYVYLNRNELLPDRIAVHWNAAGQADDFRGRDQMGAPLFLMPLCMAGVLLLALALPWLSPENFKVETFRSTYDFIMGLMMVMFAYMHGIFLAAYMEYLVDVQMLRWLMGGMFVALGLLGNVLGKVKKNFWIGIRTPWTLASDAVWSRTHRLAAWLFTGGAVLALALLVAGVQPMICMPVFGVAAILPVFYSLYLYKKLEREGRLGAGEKAAQ